MEGAYYGSVCDDEVDVQRHFDGTVLSLLRLTLRSSRTEISQNLLSRDRLADLAGLSQLSSPTSPTADDKIRLQVYRDKPGYFSD
jgi:hypothetical protein